MSALYPDVTNKRVVIVYKISRFAHTEEKGSRAEREYLLNDSDPIVKDMKRAHENNLSCLEKVIKIVENLGLSYDVICRSSLTQKDIDDQLVIAVGGDGTVLDTSHYCVKAPLLGLNSDPEQSVGALCIANYLNLHKILQEILAKQLIPSAIQRLSININGHTKKLQALNDVLYCHQNPASTSRYHIETKGLSESHRSSGIWVATAAGSTGGIFSCGGPALPIEAKEAIFRVREPYWSSEEEPKLFEGKLKPSDILTIRSNMTDAHIYIDGPHKSFKVPFGESVSLGLAKNPLWLYDGKILDQARHHAILQRMALRRQ